MVKRVQRIGHIKSAADLFLGRAREITVNTTDNAARVHDGATIGGHEMARKDVANVAAATGSNDGKMTSTQAGDLSTTKSNVDAHIGAASGHPVATTIADGFESAADKTKLDGIETAATADQTAVDIRALGFFDISNDGVGSGLDADLLDGEQGSFYASDAAVTAALASQLATLRGELNAPTGTKGVFAQTAAPTGWTKDTVHDNKALRVVSGAVSSGGATAFTSVFGAGKNSGGTALTVAQLAAHTHNYNLRAPSGSPSLSGPSTISSVPMPETASTSAGSGDTHNHTLSLDLQYVDIIIATKDA